MRAGCPLNGGIPNLTYRSQNWASHWMGQHNWNASMTYVTGAHSMKFGYQGTFYVDDEQIFTNDENVVYRLNNGVPNLITQTLDPTCASCARATTPSTRRSSGRWAG